MVRPAPAAIAAAPPSVAPSRRVFVIDDDPVMLLSCRRILEKEGYDVETYSSGTEGIRRLEVSRPELLLVDLKMPELDGLEVIDRVRAIDPAIVIAVITGYATVATAIDAMQAGAYDFLPKPFTPDELRLLVNRGHERWRLAAESARLRREKEEAERRFITFVSHQLKSPVVAAKQYLDVLLFTSPGDLPPHARDWLERAQARLDEMLGLIHDWLELAHIDRGVPGDMVSSCAIDAVLGHVLERLKPQADGAGVTLVGDAEPGIVVRGDQVSLDTVLSNLLTNAIKYNKVGGTARVRIRSDAPFARIEVTDTGIGIADEFLPRLFDEFFRIRTEQTRDIPGSGLGLAICRRLVTAMGGDITVNSVPGAGTTFVVRLQLDRGTPAASTGDSA